MKDDKPHERFVFAARAVNRRTTRVPSEPAEAVANATQALRARKALSRHQLGPSLASATRPAQQKQRRLPGAALALIVGAVMLIPIALLTPSTGLRIGVGCAALLMLAGAARHIGRAAKASQAAETVGMAIDPELLASLDRLLDAASAELPAAVIASLLSMKASLVRVLQLMPDAKAGELFTMDDRLYVVECIRRYVPDTVEAYLRVPTANRDFALEHGRSASQVFIDQLQLIQQALEHRERKGAMAAGDRLMQQQRFLEAKSKER